MRDDPLIAEFTHQAEAFNESPVMRADKTLAALVELVPPSSTACWLEAACGPGIVSREVAPRVGEVHGVDLTPRMVEVARREARAAGVANVSFSVGDVTSLELPDASFDGAVARFTLHHIPLPGRVIAELARVVRPGGLIILADHVTDSDAEAAAWHQEIERLRDPSHWGCLTSHRLRSLVRRYGLTVDHERLTPLTMDFEEWLVRGSGGGDARALIEQALSDPPPQAQSFRLTEREGRRELDLVLWLALLRR